MISKKIQEFAKKGLNQCYTNNGIYAGTHQFKDYWARDSMWASIGALKLKNYGVVKSNLMTFFKFERKGMIPLRVGNWSVFQTYLGLKSSKLWAKYSDHQNNSFTSDSTTLTIIVFCEYFQETNDVTFVKNNIPKIERVLSKLFILLDSDLLIKEDYYSTWMDGIKKRGKTFYSNILYYVALKNYLDLLNKLKLTSKLVTKKHLTELRNNLNETFWNGSYFTDWVGNNDADYFDTFANLIAIYFKFTTKEQSNSIFEFIEKKDLIKNSGMILKSYPDYNPKYISSYLKLVGLQGYCDSITYPWMSLFYFLNLKKTNKLNKTNNERLNRLFDLILKEGVIHECYSFNLKPYKNLIYKSEHPFAWACSYAILLTKE